MSPAELGRYADVMREKGIVELEVPGVNGAPIHIRMTEGKSTAPLADDRPGLDPDQCACGHHLTEHTEGGCMHCLDSAKCGPVLRK